MVVNEDQISIGNGLVSLEAGELDGVEGAIIPIICPECGHKEELFAPETELTPAGN